MYSRDWADDVVRLARRFAGVLFSGNASELLALSPATRRNAMKALSALARFLGHEWVKRWKEIREAYGLKWGNGSEFHPLLSSETFSGMLDWVRRVLENIEDSRPVVFFALLTGLRSDEVFASMRLVKERLDEYLDRGLGVLQHFKFPEIFLRRTKRAYISVWLDELKQLAEQLKHSYEGFRSMLRRAGLECRLNYCRKIYASYLRKCGIEPEIIDLLQGRLPNSIFVKHYYRPEIKDELDRVRNSLSRMLDHLGLRAARAAL